MTKGTFQKVIDEIHEDLAYLILYFQGEPYLNPIFLDAVRYASNENIYAATSTNAHYLTAENASETVKSGLNRIIVSMDGIDQQSYEKYRLGGKLDKVINGIENLVKARKASKSHTPYIILNSCFSNITLIKFQELENWPNSWGWTNLT